VLGFKSPPSLILGPVLFLNQVVLFLLIAWVTSTEKLSSPLSSYFLIQESNKFSYFLAY
jgi:hypothetical protein